MVLNSMNTVIGLLLPAIGPAQLALLAWYLAMSAVTFAMYGRDKSAAKQGRWRTPELTLHLASLVGGWPGALLGQRVFRHKTRKQPFRAIFWVTVVANLVALVWLLGRL